MADPNLSELDATTLKEIYPKTIEDNFFLSSPVLAYIRDHCLVPWGGGAHLQSTFLYAPVIGGFYAQGDSFNITKPKTLEGLVWDMKQVEVNVTEYLEELELNRGPQAVFSLVEADLRNAIQTANAIIAVAMYRHGQTAGGAVVDNRPKAINGLSELINDGVTNSWDGNVFVTYGNMTRNGSIANALNSIPQWAGDAAGNPGMITYNILEEAYQDASIGKEEPDLGTTSKAGYAYCKERMQVHQRFAQERDPVWGVTGWRFNNAMILKDDYAPSLRYGRNVPVIGNYLTAAFTSSGSPAAQSNLPAATTVTPGEVFFWLNTKKINFRVSNDPKFGFGFTGFKVAQDNTRVAGQILAKVNLVSESARLQKQIYGFTS
jgi:hypothetical protein